MEMDHMDFEEVQQLNEGKKQRENRIHAIFNR